MSEIPHPFVVETMNRFEVLPIIQKKKVRFIHLNHSNPLLDPKSEASAVVVAKGYQLAVEGEKIDL